MAGLELHNITKSFGPLVANDGVNLSVAKGEIHGLLGENGAGKTTLMNILFGLETKDSGEIRVAGKMVEIHSPADAAKLGIGMVHQHFMLVPNMTVAENIALTRHGQWLSNDISLISKRITELSDLYRFGISPDAKISDLSVGQQQRVEILKLLYADMQIMVLDEPTAVLAPDEWRAFADLLRQFADEGRSIVFISHKMKEQFDVSENCTILRRGKVVGNLSMATATESEIVEMMVGRPLEKSGERPHVPSDASIVFKIQNLSAVSESGKVLLDDVSLDLREGETLGIAGVDGNGQEELVDAILGLLPIKGGSVFLNGEDITGGPPAIWRNHQGALITADRHTTSVALELSIEDNMLVTTAKENELLKSGIIKSRTAKEFVDARLAEFDVYGGSASLPMKGLSGGNQQKVVLGRELGQEATIAIAAQPTRGLDIGAAQSVFATLTKHKENRGSTLLISTEIDELLLLCDRIAVILHGRILGVLENNETFEFERLAHLMAGEILQ